MKKVIIHSHLLLLVNSKAKVESWVLLLGVLPIQLPPPTRIARCLIRKIPKLCLKEDDFGNFCFRASEFADPSNGAPLFTVTQTHNLLKAAAHHETSCDSSGVHEGDPLDLVPTGDAENNTQEDDWQIL